MSKLKVTLFTARFGGPYRWGQDLAAELSSQGAITNHIASRAMYFAELPQTSADIIHTTIPLPLKLWRRPTLLTIQGDYTEEYNILQRHYYRAVAQTDTITTSSSYLKNKIPLPVTTVVIPNAVFPERFRPTEHGTRERLNLTTIMNFYFEDKVRGLVDLFDALRESELTNLRCIVVGDGPYRSAVEAHALRTGLDIIFCGMLEDVGLVLSNSDIFVYYSHQDSFPNVLAEAMASKLPVLTNNFGSVGEIVEHGHDGLIADNPGQFAEMLRRLFKDVGYRRELGENARISVEQKFSWPVVAERFLQIYNKLLNGRLEGTWLR